MKENMLVLVDEKDQEVGQMDKMEVHQKGLLHRAVSVFVVDLFGNWLLQKRAANKYHSANLWTNACCTHPYPGETPLQAARRRLYEEMGIECDLQHLFTFLYNEDVGNGLIENEFDHIFLGIYTGEVKPNPEEVADYKFVSFAIIDADISVNPQNYTVWFRKLYNVVQPYIIDKVNIQYE